MSLGQSQPEQVSAPSIKGCLTGAPLTEATGSDEARHECFLQAEADFGETSPYKPVREFGLQRHQFFLLSAGCLMLGLLMYIFKSHSADPANYIYRHVPDGLWAASFMAAITFIWFDQAKPRYLWSVASIALMILFEFFQYNGLISGTGDPVDVLYYLFFSLPVMVLNKKQQTTNN